MVMSSLSAEEIMNRRNFLRLALAGAASLAGCQTANYDRRDVNRVNKKAATSESSVPAGLSVQQSNSVDYETSQEMEKRYEGLANVNTNLYLAKPGEGIIKPRVLNRTVFHNQGWDEIRDLEAMVFENSDRYRLPMGGPDWHLASPRSADNQFSSASGVLGIDNYGIDNSPFRFLVNAKEVTGIKKWRNRQRYDISVTFGQEAFKATKKRTDVLFLVEGVENAAIAFVVAGPYGAIGSGFQTVIEGLWAYFEGSNPPNRTYFVDERIKVGSRGNADDVFDILGNAHEIRAQNVIAYKYSDKSVGVVYINGHLSNVRTEGNNLMFTTDYAGVVHLHSFFYRALGQATRRIPWSVSDPSKKVYVCPEGEGGLDRHGGPINGGITSGGIVR